MAQMTPAQKDFLVRCIGIIFVQVPLVAALFSFGLENDLGCALAMTLISFGLVGIFLPRRLP